MKHQKVRQLAGQKGGKSRSARKLRAIKANLKKARSARWTK